ncbi:hypothetical protein KC19_1G014200 [Ceratodon purpureus]|uniref:Uncharacterized protein n=1 Tax=Ceratodon purpureus TaxID=3225 RepID=A0A8T0J302_CERPU|nr:hypothetical protein KC19_1G014200 [Ceratodon purpureus]
MKTPQSMATKGQGMLFCNCICSWQPVRVVHGDGHIRSLTRPVTVGELLKHHPHHFVCEPTSNGPLYHSGMLPLDMELEEGRIYLLLPLPRLLPHLASTFPNPPCCPCFSHRETMHSNSAQKYDSKSFSEEHSRLKSWLARNQDQFLVAASTMRKFRHRVVKSKLVRSLVRMSKRMLPDRLRLRLSFQKLEDFSKGSTSSSVVGKSVQYCSRNRWRPGLECISEVDLLTGLLRDSVEVGEYR